MPSAQIIHDRHLKDRCNYSKLCAKICGKNLPDEPITSAKEKEASKQGKKDAISNEKEQKAGKTSSNQTPAEEHY